MEAAIKKNEEHYTYADYLEWDTEERYELIDGVPYLMSPAPTPIHQKILMELATAFFSYLADKQCIALAAPIDVRLNADTGDDTVVQPDILVVCDRSKIDKRGVKGAPDLVVEILSSSTRAYDSYLKLNKYLKAGVRECWIVDPEENIVRVYQKNDDGKTTMEEYAEQDTVTVGIFPDLRISMTKIFADAKFY
ncbi:MAG: Uma2 family endonuclease [Acidobacteria bacterium]|nr:Uma2 family endonuclease [Acidobacteriota bacterium]